MADESIFVGRDFERAWIHHNLHRRKPVESRLTKLAIVGQAGIGKTALAKAALDRDRIQYPIWLNCHDEPDVVEQANYALREANNQRRRSDGFIVVVDECDDITGRQHDGLMSVCRNYKLTRTMLFLSREPTDFGFDDTLALGPLRHEESVEMLAQVVGKPVDPKLVEGLLAAAKNSPLAIRLLGELLRGDRANEMAAAILGRPVYELKSGLLVPDSKIVAATEPIIVRTNHDLIQKLKKEPESIYKVTSRKFEEIVADLLQDLGYEVELTPPSKDGGRDILATKEFDVGKVLTLVDAKKYRKTNKVGVELVRQLYGLLNHERATMGMIVTTSSFTKGAKDLQQDHKYQITLKDYFGVASWLDGYKGKPGST